MTGKISGAAKPRWRASRVCSVNSQTDSPESWRVAAIDVDAGHYRRASKQRSTMVRAAGTQARPLPEKREAAARGWPRLGRGRVPRRGVAGRVGQAGGQGVELHAQPVDLAMQAGVVGGQGIGADVG